MIITMGKQTVKEIALIYVTSSRSEIKIDSYVKLMTSTWRFPHKAIVYKFGRNISRITQV